MRELIQTESAGPGRPRLDEIQEAMQIEYDRALAGGVPVAFLRIEIAELDRIGAARGPEERELVVRAVVDLLRSQPRGGDLFLYRVAQGVVAMLTGTPAEAGEVLGRLVIEGCRKLPLPGGRSLRIQPCIGLAATRPERELFFETLLEVAAEGAIVSAASGGGSVAHTELYDLHQRRLERERPAPLARRPATSTPSAPSIAARASTAPAHATPGRAMNGTAAKSPAAPREAPAPAPGKPANALQARLRELLEDERRRHPHAAVEPSERTGAIETQHLLQRALEDQATEHRAAVDMLERRIAKLSEALEISEDSLRRILIEAGSDAGISSSFRMVQGLAPSQVDYELKLALMTQILQANLELQSKLASS